MKTVISSLCLSISLIFTTPILAAQPLNTISYHWQGQQWVSSNSAAVAVSADATVKSKTLATTQQQIIQQLQQLIAPNQWHIVQLQQHLDQSGLVRLHLVVHARLSQNIVSTLPQKLTTLSTSGKQYRLISINNQPSLADVSATLSALRAKLYGHVKQELAELNKRFPKQHYFLHSIDFTRNTFRRPRELSLLIKTPTMQSTRPLQLSQKLTLSATVIYAATTQ